jgi:hypothetical protein
LDVSINRNCFAHELFDIALRISAGFAMIIEMIYTSLTNDTQCWCIENAQFIAQTLIVNVEFGCTNANVIELIFQRTEHGQRLSTVKAEIGTSKENVRFLIAVRQNVAQKLSEKFLDTNASAWISIRTSNE